MTTYVLGKGFVSDHLDYEKILDRLSVDNVSKVLSIAKSGDTIINCIGRTGSPNVDWCEKQENKMDTAITNVVLPTLITDYCLKNNIYLIQISSGCIFYGNSDRYDGHWCENDFANPESYYSKTKYASDLIIGDLPNVANLRIRMPISSKNHPRNLINKLIKYDKILNEPNSVTFMDDLVRCINHFDEKKLSGTYHITNETLLSADQIMKEYKKYFPNHNYEIIDVNQLKQLTIATRSNCELDTSKLQDTGFKMTSTHTALKSCMAEYVKSL